MPFFSVIIPVHNRAHLIGECLASVLVQTEQDFEIIVVDNNSTDDLTEVLDVFPDPRIRMIHCRTPGPGAARNAGVREAIGTYISFLDSDDIWGPDVLQVSREQVVCGAVVVYITCSAFKHGEIPVLGEVPGRFGRVLRLTDIGEAIAMETFGTNLMAAVKKEYLIGPNSLDESLRVGEDFDWAMRQLHIGPAVILGDETRLAYRLHEVNICKNVEAYLQGTAVLVHKCLAGIYPVAGRSPVCSHTVRMLVGSASNIAHWGRPGDALFLYLKLLYLGLKWRQFNHVIVPQILRSWVSKRLCYKQTLCQ